MKQYDFTLGFAVMAANELDARVKLKELLMAISKEEIFKAMRLVKQEQCDHTFERDEEMINVCTKCGIEGEQD